MNKADLSDNKRRQIVISKTPDKTPVRRPNLPAKQPLPEKKKQSINPLKGTGKERQNNSETDCPKMADKRVTTENTATFELEETNTEKVNIANILSDNNIRRTFEDWIKEEDVKSLKSFIMAGKKFANFIKGQRQNRKKFVNVKGLNINTSLEPNEIVTTELTKQRFLAICHYYLFKSKKANNFISPLVSRVNFTKENPLTPVKELLGGGLQFLGPFFKIAFKTDDNGHVLFLISCILMDYIRVTTPEKDSEGNVKSTAKADKYASFLDYALSDEAANGDMLLAGSRNIDDTGLECIRDKMDYFLNCCQLIRVGQFGGNARDRVRSNYARLVNCEMARDLIQLMKSGSTS